ANSVIDLTEQKTHHFTQGLNGYKLLWICYIGSFAGVVVESLWCILQNGHLESRAGLVYGPFNLLYGAGAVALTAALYRFRNHGRWLSFLGGMTVGSAVEYLCSLGQEMLFGSRSWDYSNMPFNLNGRICLLYSAFWGALGVLWVKNIYPRMANWILKLPEKQGKILTWALAAFFVFNAAVSLVAVYRWSGRLSGAAAANAFWRLIDTRFPDTRMERIFANMVF
ncbi:MAG: putative ABC transporter permease, partial [Eubacteriales bacterium]